jgi:predicted  nucleic acid-binding Zn-ribbon protein
MVTSLNHDTSQVANLTETMSDAPYDIQSPVISFDQESINALTEERDSLLEQNASLESEVRSLRAENEAFKREKESPTSRASTSDGDTKDQALK